MYSYQARLVRIIDADTCVLDLDLGFYQWRLNQSYRLLRINAPERNTDAGVQAKLALGAFLPGKQLIANTQKSDSFGRFLIELYADGKNCSDWLVEQGHAIYQMYK